MTDTRKRAFIRQSGMGAIGLAVGGSLIAGCANKKGASESEASSPTSAPKDLFFQISLAQWSLHSGYFGDSLDKGWGVWGEAFEQDPKSILRGDLDPMNFPATAKSEFGIEDIELVNVFYYDVFKDTKVLGEFKRRCNDSGVQTQLIMCDRLGDLGDASEATRIKTVENHYPWIDYAAFLGCHSIRVNAAGSGTAEEVKSAAVDGLGRLSEYGAKQNINIIVENHGGYSSDGKWLVDVMQQVNMSNCGTLPDFGNFCIESGPEGCAREYDRYRGVKELMPYAKGVSAKSHDFNAEGQEIHTDFGRMLQIVKDADFNGYIGVEYEGTKLSEEAGIRATKKLLEKIGARLS